MSTKTRARLIGIAVLAVTGALVVPSVAHAEDSDSIDFSTGYALGQDTPAGQNGWKGFVMGHFDWALENNATFPASGLPTDGVSLRFSNWIGNVNQWANISQLISPVIEPAGEPSTGAVNNTFETNFTVASATGALQERLAITVNIDNGSGSRSGGVVGIMHSPNGLQLYTSGVAPGSGSDVESDYTTQFSGYYDATVPHSVRIVSEYITNAPDRVSVYIDGSAEPVLVGDTYEEYHVAESTSLSSRQSAALLIRAARLEPSAPGSVSGFGTSSNPTTGQLAALKDKGFLLSDLTYSTYNKVPAAAPVLPATVPAATPGSDLDLSNSQLSASSPITLTATGMTPGELVGFTVYSTPTFVGYATADASGTATLTVALPASLAAGSHTAVAIGVTSGAIGTSAFSVLALAATGVESGALLAIAGGALVLGAFAAAVGSRRRTRGRMA